MTSGGFPLPNLGIFPTSFSNFAPSFNPFVPRPGLQGYCMPGMPQPLPVSKGPQITQQNPHFACKNCSKDFQSKAQYDAHMQHHQRCQHPGCAFEGTRRAVNIHAEEEHPFIHALVPKLETPEQIAKWRADRKRRYPTLENIKRKEAEQQDRERRGQVAEVEKFCHRQGGRQRRRGQRGHGSHYGQRRNFGSEPCYKQPYSAREVTSTQVPPAISCQNNEKRIEELGGQCANDDSSLSDDDVSALNQHGLCGDNGRMSSEASQFTSNGLLLAAVKDRETSPQRSSPNDSEPSRQDVNTASALQSLSTVYDSTDGECSESDNEAQSTNHRVTTLQVCVDSQSHSTSMPLASIKECVAESCSTAKCEERLAIGVTGSEVCEDQHDNDGDGDVNVSEQLLVNALASDIGQQGSWQGHKSSISGSSSKKQQQRSKRRRKAHPHDSGPYSKPTLLEKLLAPEIRRERNVILQCLRYIVTNDFFGVAETTSSLN